MSWGFSAISGTCLDIAEATQEVGTFVRYRGIEGHEEADAPTRLALKAEAPASHVLASRVPGRLSKGHEL